MGQVGGRADVLGAVQMPPEVTTGVISQLALPERLCRVQLGWAQASWLHSSLLARG